MFVVSRDYRLAQLRRCARWTTVTPPPRKLFRFCSCDSGPFDACGPLRKVLALFTIESLGGSARKLFLHFDFGFHCEKGCGPLRMVACMCTCVDLETSGKETVTLFLHDSSSPCGLGLRPFAKVTFLVRL